MNSSHDKFIRTTDKYHEEAGFAFVSLPVHRSGYLN